MERGHYRLVLIDSSAKSINRLSVGSLEDAANADLIVGRGNRVLKDRDGIAGVLINDAELQFIREEADEVRER